MILLRGRSGFLVLSLRLLTLLAAEAIAQRHFISVKTGPEDLIEYDMGKVFHPGNGLFI